MTLTLPDRQMHTRTPDDYARDFAERMASGYMLRDGRFPWPSSREELHALDAWGIAHGTRWARQRADWGSLPTSWYPDHWRVPEPVQPDPPELDDDHKQLFVNSLTSDTDFRAAVASIVGGPPDESLS